jgi:3-oxoacyl-[acyl-carrier-protein] synthase I
VRSAQVAVVVGMGSATSIGLTPWAVAAAVAGGVSRFVVHETMRHARTGAPVKLAASSRLPVPMGGLKRMAWLARIAADQALSSLPDTPSQLRSCALVSVPPQRPGNSVPEAGAIVRELLGRLPGTAQSNLCGLYDSGHEGGLAALGRALDVLRAGEADVWLVGGFDSLCDADLLDWLAEEGRLKDDVTPYGMIPGEGAAFVTLVSESFQKKHRWPSTLGRILTAVRETEPAPWYMGNSTQGVGLTRALTRALLPCAEDGSSAQVTYCDLNGEAWRADEWSFAYLRTGKHHGEPLNLIHPSDCWGDVGAASAPLLLNAALCDLQRERIDAERVLVWCASDTRPYRGAALIERSP